MVDMDVELLVVPNRLSELVAAQRLRNVLDELALALVQVRTTVIGNADAAVQRRFGVLRRS